MSIISNRNFRALWASQTISNSGDTIFSLAVIWYVLTNTNSIILVGLVVAASFLPDILVAPFAGTYIDRFNRRSIIMLSYTLQSVLVGGAGILYFLHKFNFVFSLFTVIGLGIGEQFSSPANAAILPAVVDNENLIPANGLISSSNSFNMLGSNAIGGILIVLFGVAAPFEYDAITFLIAAVLLNILPRATGLANESTHHEKMGDNNETIISRLRVGFHYLRNDGLLLRLAILSTLVSFFALGLQGIYAPYVKDDLSGGAAIYGYFLATFAFGSILGSLFVGKYGKNIRTGRLIMLGLVGQAITILGLGFTHSAAIALSLWTMCGVSQSINTVPYQSFLQTRISRSYYGRVSTLMSSMIYMPAPLLIILTSSVTSRLSPPIMLTTYGFAMLLCIVISFASSKQLRKLDIKERIGGTMI